MARRRKIGRFNTRHNPAKVKGRKPKKLGAFNRRHTGGQLRKAFRPAAKRRRRRRGGF